MEGIKEKGILRRFVEWLSRVDEDTIDDKGSINDKAFTGENPEVLKELKSTSNNINKMTEMFKQSIVKHVTTAPLKDDMKVQSNKTSDTTKTGDKVSQERKGEREIGE